MVFADAEHIETHLIGQLNLLEQVPHALIRSNHLPTARVRCSLDEAVNADLHLPSMDAARACRAPEPSYHHACPRRSRHRPPCPRPSPPWPLEPGRAATNPATAGRGASTSSAASRG